MRQPTVAVGGVADVRSATPLRGAVHVESGLPFNTGARVRAGRHNVGQDWTLPTSMDAGVWSGTWLQNVTIRPDLARAAHYLEFAATSTRSSRMHLHQCVVAGDVSVRVGEGSTVDGLEGTRGDGRFAPTLRARGQARATNQPSVLVKNVHGFSAIDIAGSGVRARSLSADRIRYAGTGVSTVDGSEASDHWLVPRGAGRIAIDRPGQWLIVGPDFAGEIVQHQPAVVTYADFAFGAWFPVVEGSRQDAESGGEYKFTIKPYERLRCDLARRPADGSAGLYLHPHNTAAWDFIKDGDLVIVNRAIVPDPGHPDDPALADETVTYAVDESVLDLALTLHPNP